MCKKNGCEEYSICEVGEFLESEYVCPYSVTDEDIVRANDPAARASTPQAQAGNTRQAVICSDEHIDITCYALCPDQHGGKCTRLDDCRPRDRKLTAMPE
jgi:hypothetical protein